MNRLHLRLLTAIALLGLIVGRAEGDEIRIDDTLTMHYVQSGRGETTIIFIPGWMMSTDVFEHQLAHFDGSTKYRAGL